jgi:hypothetical protein
MFQEDDYKKFLVYLNYMFNLELMNKPPSIEMKSYFRALYKKFEVWYNENKVLGENGTSTNFQYNNEVLPHWRERNIYKVPRIK